MTDLHTHEAATGTGDRSRPRAALPALCATQITSWGIVYYAFPVLLPQGTISQAVRVTWTRTTPYRGLHKTHLGHVLTAAELNLHRLNTWWTGTPIGTTHISRFARLGLELAAIAHRIHQQSPSAPGGIASLDCSEV